MTKAPIPIASVPRGAPPQAIRTKATIQPPQAEPKGTKTSEAQPARSFDEVLTSTRDQAAGAAQPTAQSKPERAEDAPSEPTESSESTEPIADAHANPDSVTETPAASQEIATDHTPLALPAAERRKPVAPGVSPGSNASSTPEPRSGDRIAPPLNLQTEPPAQPQHTSPLPTNPRTAPSPQAPGAIQTRPAPAKPIFLPVAASNSIATEPNATSSSAQAPPPTETVQPQAAPALIQPQPRRQSTAESSPSHTPKDASASVSVDPLVTKPAGWEPATSDQPRPAPAPDPAAPTPPPHAATAPPRNTDSIFQLESAPQSSDAPAAPDSTARQPSSTQPTISRPTLSAAPQPQDVPPAPQLVSRGLSAALAQRGGVVHVRLVPVSLGEVRIHMTLDAGIVSVRIDAATPAAQNLLNDHLGMLRSSLEARGLQVDRLAVNLTQPAPATPTNTPNHGQSSADPYQSPSHNNQQDAAGSQSRGRSDDDPHGPNNRDLPPDEPEEANTATQPTRNFGSRLRMRLSTVA